MALKKITKALFFPLILVLLPVVAFCTNYYISNSGNDDNIGTSAGLAWQTIAKLNAASFKISPGDSILFKRGETFFGSIRLRAGGTKNEPIVFSAYGEGSSPVITGFVTIKGWQKKENNIWEATAPMLSPMLNMVIINGQPQQIGRYPNAGAAGGNLSYESFAGKFSITDNELDKSINWEGAEIVVRKNLWAAERCRVVKQQGNTITFTNAYPAANGNNKLIIYDGIKSDIYFFQKSYRTLDQQGEWFFDSSNKKLQMVLNDTSVVVKASVIDTLVYTGAYSYINFSGLSFEGANMAGIFNRGGNYITVSHCSFTNIGGRAIHFWNTGDVIIDDVQTNNILSSAIQISSLKKENATVKNCSIKNTGLLIGMGSFFDDMDYKAISAVMASNVLIENNNIDSVGLTGIQFQGSNVLVQHNFINHYCLVLHDSGGVYTFLGGEKDNPRPEYVNRVVKENFIFNGGGMGGNYNGRGKAEGVYTDGGSVNIDIINNTIGFVSNKAFATNNPLNVKINNNTCFNNGGGWGAARVNTWQKFGGLEVKNNIFYSLYNYENSVNFLYNGLDTPEDLTIWEAIKLAGDADGNYYNTTNPFGFIYAYSAVADKTFAYPSPLTFEQWQSFTNQDRHSKRPAKTFPVFTLAKKAGDDLVKNGKFESGTNNIQVHGSGIKSGWDNSGKVTGKGSLKIECVEPQPNRFALVHSQAGVLQKGKKYLLSFKTAGTSDCGIVRAYLRKTESPYTIISAIQRQPFGTDKKTHEFLLEPDAGGETNFVIEIEKNSCTVYIDDIELHEADGVFVNIRQHTRLEYNTTGNAVDVLLDKNYIGVDGTKYKGKITLAPYRSEILIEDTSF